jgi:protein-tyrosine phosphatase
MGIGRSALLAACVLVGQGLTTEAAFERISKARGTKVPDTEEQIQWVLEFSSRLAGDTK